MTEVNTEQHEQLWTDFLRRWPMAALENMTLEQYTASGTDDSFIYWLESRTAELGSIWGGSAFKFGVYSRKDTADRAANNKRGYTDEYGWLYKYGDTPQAAFDTVMQEIVKAAHAAGAGDLNAIDAVDLGETIRWKIAFLYQDRSRPCIAPVLKGYYLRTLLDNPSLKLPEAHRQLMATRGERPLFDYASTLWQRIEATLDKSLSTEQALTYLQQSDCFTAIKEPTKYLAGFVSDEGLQLALSVDTKKVSMYISPGSWQSKMAKHFSKPDTYAKDTPRNSNLAANAPMLALGNDCVKVTVNTLDDLIQLCSSYAGQEEPGSQPSTKNTEDTHMQSTLDHVSLNQILYGPPGTGKTYETTRLAVSIADPDWMAQEFDSLNNDPARQRAALKTRYLELVEDQRIVFTTFHQSFSYEDFVEGIRPETDEDSGTLNYTVSDGIFKTLCLNAQSTVVQISDETISLESRRIWKMSLGNTLKDDDDIYEECLEEGYVLLGYGGDLDFRDCDDRQTVKTYIEKQWGKSIESNDYTLTSVNAFKNQMQHGDLIVVSDGNHKFRAIGEVTGDYHYLSPDDRARYQQMRPVRWLRQYDPSLPKERLFKKSLSQMTLYELKPKTVDHQKLQHLLEPEAKAQADKKPHVLIIDEINRGNISRILGELITLLEPSKRIGASDEQTVKLPYSKEVFSVPDNVHIIGTMNTADKSLAQMDLALRRRFSFIETPPDPSLLKGVTVHGVNMAQLLETINQRIEVLLDAEHMIGHAYFMPLLSLDDEASRQRTLASIFKDKIIPLLQEYFFDDYERIGWVINGSTKEHEHQFIQSHNAAALPALTKLFPNGVADQLADRRFRINRAACDKAEAYQGIVA